MSLSDLKVGDKVCFGELEGTVERVLKNGFIALNGRRFTSFGEEFGKASGRWNRERLEVLTPELKARRDEQQRFDKASLSASRSIETLERKCRHIRNARFNRRSPADLEQMERIATALEAIVKGESADNG